MPRRSSYPAEVRAGVVAALKSGAGLRETARRYDVPLATAVRWRAELDAQSDHETGDTAAAQRTLAELASGTDAAPVPERSGTPPWYPQRTGSIDGEVRALAEEMIFGARILMASLVHPANLTRAEYGDVVAALNTVADRVARVAEASLAVHDEPPALPPG